jgi:hypothetical protein
MGGTLVLVRPIPVILRPSTLAHVERKLNAIWTDRPHAFANRDTFRALMWADAYDTVYYGAVDPTNGGTDLLQIFASRMSVLVLFTITERFLAGSKLLLRTNTSSSDWLGHFGVSADTYTYGDMSRYQDAIIATQPTLQAGVQLHTLRSRTRRLRRIVRLVGWWRRAILLMYEEITFRPGNRGALAAHAHFVASRDGDTHDVRALHT